MATVTIACVSNSDGTMTVSSTDTAGLKVIVTNPTGPNDVNNAHWAARHLKDFVLAQLYST